MSFAASTSLAPSGVSASPTVEIEQPERLPVHRAVALIVALSLTLWSGIGMAVYYLVG